MSFNGLEVSCLTAAAHSGGPGFWDCPCARREGTGDTTSMAPAPRARIRANEVFISGSSLQENCPRILPPKSGGWAGMDRREGLCSDVQFGTSGRPAAMQDWDMSPNPRTQR